MPDFVERLLGGELADWDSAGKLSVPVRSIAIRPTLRGAEADLATVVAERGRLLIVSDQATNAVLGHRVETVLTAVRAVATCVLPSDITPNMREVAPLCAAASGCDGLIAVGSGTVNDLVKFAAHRLGKPYAVFATAPSMNGYTSVNAAITEDGHKKSLRATAPVGAFFDLEVLAKAPRRLIQSGFGDSLCRSTAQADWLLSHLLLGTAYRCTPFALLEADEAELLRRAPGLLHGDIAAVEALTRTLVLSGLGMTIVGGSYPASQGEHLISHYIDMFGDPAWPASYHGEHIAVTTLTMAAIQQRVLATDRLRYRPERPSVSTLDTQFGATAASIRDEFAAKVAAIGPEDRFEAKLREWPDIAREVAGVALPVANLRAGLTAIDGPATPAAINVPDRFYSQAVAEARYIRSRYTFLDLASDCGLMFGFTGHDAAA